MTEAISTGSKDSPCCCGCASTISGLIGSAREAVTLAHDSEPSRYRSIELKRAIIALDELHAAMCCVSVPE